MRKIIFRHPVYMTQEACMTGNNAPIPRVGEYVSIRGQKYSVIHVTYDIDGTEPLLIYVDLRFI